MLDDFDRRDVLDLHRLVKARYMTSSPEGYDLMLWGDLKTLFEPDEEEEKKYLLTQEMLSKMLSRKLKVDHENEMAFELLSNALGYSIFRCYSDLGVLQIAVMSSASSAVTYTSVYTDSEPGRVFWGADEEISDGEEPQTPPVPQDEDEREPMFIQPHDPDYVPEPIYPEYIPLEDEHEFPVEEQPLPPVDSPTAESPGYVAESDPEEYEDDETEDGLVDYPMDGGDDGDDDDGDSSGDDADDEDEDEEETEEEHLAPTDSAIVVPTVEPVSPPKGIEPVIPPPSTDITTTGARIIVRLQASISLPPEAEVERLLAMPTPPPSLPISLSEPMQGRALHMRPALIMHINHKHLSSARPHQRRGSSYGFVSTLDAEERRRGIREVGYGIKDTWVDPAEAVPKIAPMTVGEVNTRGTELAELHEHDTHDLYALFEDSQDSRTRIS
ncbi:hypothetical protein Tco_1314621 [Tanacetum coccineum]